MILMIMIVVGAEAWWCSVYEVLVGVVFLQQRITNFIFNSVNGDKEVCEHTTRGELHNKNGYSLLRHVWDLDDTSLVLQTAQTTGGGAMKIAAQLRIAEQSAARSHHKILVNAT